MEIKKPSDAKLIKQIKTGRKLFYFFIIIGGLCAAIFAFTGESEFLFVMLLFAMFGISINFQEYFDKIRLEIRDLKRRR